MAPAKGAGHWFGVATLGVLTLGAASLATVALMGIANPRNSPASFTWRGTELVLLGSPSVPSIRAGDVLIAVDGVASPASPAGVAAFLDNIQPGRQHVLRVRRGDADVDVPIQLERTDPATLAFSLLLPLISALGLLAHLSSDANRGRRQFVALAGWTTALSVWPVWNTWHTIRLPMTDLITDGQGLFTGVAMAYALIVWPSLFGLFLGRFMIETGRRSDPEYRWLFGRRLTALLSICILVPAIAATTLNYVEGTVWAASLGLPVALFFAATLARRRRFVMTVVMTLLPASALWLAVSAVLVTFAPSAPGTIARSVAEAVLVTWTVLSLVTLFRWPLRMWRMSTAIYDTSLAARQTETAMAGVRYGAVLFVVVIGAAALGLAVGLARTFTTADGTLAPAARTSAYVLALLFVVALAMPFVGVFLAITKNGLWNADLLLRRMVVTSGVGASVLIVWEVAVFVLGALAQDTTGAIWPALAIGVLLAALRPRLDGRVDRFLFPRSRQTDAAIERLGELAAISGYSCTRADLELIGAAGATFIWLQSETAAQAWTTGHKAQYMAAAGLCAAWGGERYRRFVVVDGDYITYAFRIVLGDNRRGLVVIEPIRGARLYNPQQMVQLGLLLQILAPRMLVAETI